VTEADAAGASAERRVLEAIDADGLVVDLLALAEVSSITGNEDWAQQSVVKLTKDCGLRVDACHIDLAELQRHRAYSALVERNTEPLCVVGVVDGAGGGRNLILNGHVDVAPIGDECRPG
jgi:acetylornithine deacetylase